MNLLDLLLQTTQDTIVLIINGILSVLPSPTILPAAFNTAVTSFFIYLLKLDKIFPIDTFFAILSIQVALSLGYFLFKLSLYVIRIIRG